jgi:hypothetical protein
MGRRPISDIQNVGWAMLFCPPYLTKRVHMGIEFIDSRIDLPTHSVRVMSPLGVYPADSIVNRDFAFVANDDICFTVAPYSRDKIDIKHYYSEVEWATINEIRLFSSILLSIDRDVGYSRIYPFYTSHFIKVSSNETIEDHFDAISKQLVEIINAPPKIINGFSHPATNAYRTSKGISLPPACGGPDYDLRKDGYQYNLQKEIFNKFDIKDFLMIRGVSTLLRSGMLTAHYHFLEEAINTTFISLEASFRLVLRKLKEIGINNPSSKDAADYIANVFYSDAANKYFEEYYESRIMSFHPESRFGVFPHAPLMADDCYHLFDDLIEVYCYLICDHVHPKHQERFNRFRT